MEQLKLKLATLGQQVRTDKTDYIKTFAALANTTQPKAFEKAFRQWLVNAVHNVFEPNKNTNPQCLVLCDHPDEIMSAYSFISTLTLMWGDLHDDFLKANQRDIMELCSSRLIVGIDAYEWNDKTSIKLKQLLSLDQLKYRKVYHKTAEIYPITASFILRTSTPSTELPKNRFIQAFDVKKETNDTMLSDFDFLDKVWGQAHQEHLSTALPF